MSFLGGLIDSFTGEGAKRNIQEGMDKSASALQQGRDQQTSAIQGAGTEARGYYSPYVAGGQKSYGLYNDTLGVNGAEARQNAQNIYNSDDMLAQNRAYDLKRSGWQKNASGDFNSGTAALADSRVRMRGYGDWQNRLMQGGQTGLQAASGAAGVAQNEGNALAGAYGGYGRDLANVYSQGYGGLAQANNTFAQNLIGTAGTLVRAFNPLGGINYISPNGGSAQGGKP